MTTSMTPTPPAKSTTMKRVLLVEDEPGLVLTLTDRLAQRRLRRAVGVRWPVGLARATRERWDVILLDVMLPGASGFDVCRDLRQRGVTTPVIMLTARGQVVDKVLGLKLGADDYLTKPFDMLELTARIEVQLRRASTPSTAPNRYHLRRHRARLPQGRGHAPRPAGRAVGARVPAAEVFRRASRSHAHARRAAQRSLGLSLDAVHAHRGRARRWLRQKIEPNPRHPQYLLTIHGMGYKFVG